ncbi:glycosyltransferase family 39 protein [Streptomyces platensis]|uniref:glycosyltransferase family 39 protein n=1 Tax=Streptomyces platensis TaxID=58346 RepID=UPI002E14F528|nr:glycosyltransferase family 39 protein [Streptomyces platensis]
MTLTAAAAVQQLLLATGLGGWLPGWQPWPYLLGAAPAWLIARPYWPRALGSWPVRPKCVALLRRVPVWAFVTAVLSLTVGVWAALQDDEPYIGHEEAVYANKARSWQDGTPDAGWGVYRPIGLPVLGRIALALHDDVGALRATTLVLTLLTLSVTYFAASRWTTPRQAVVTMLLLLSGLGFLRRVPEFLNDIGSTGLLLIVVFLLIRAQEKARSRALLIAPLVILAAFYLRYGVVGNLLAIAVAAVVVYGPRAWLAHWRHLTLAGIALLAGLVPHFVYAVHVTGSPLGVILYATEQAERDFIGDGLLYYLAIFPYRLAGDLGAVVMAAGTVVTWLAIRGIRRTRREHSGTPLRDDRRRAFLGTASLLIFVILGVATDGEPRFVYLPVILLTTLGVQYISELTARWSPQALLAIASLAGLTIFGTTQVVAHGAMPGPTSLSHSTVPVARQLSSKEPCLLVTGYEPEVGWYSGCGAVTYAQYSQMVPPRDTKISFILFERGRLQPDAAGLQRLIGSHPHTSRTIQTDGPLGTSTVITLTPGAGKGFRYGMSVSGLDKAG